MTDKDEKGATVDRHRVLTFLADFNRSEFRAFDGTKAGLVGCGASAGVVLLGLGVAWLIVGWSAWLVAGAVGGGALVWPCTRLVDRQTVRAMAGRLRESATKKGLPFDEAAFRDAALAAPAEMKLSYREVGFVFRILVALGVPSGDAQDVVDRLERDRVSQQAREAERLDPELFENRPRGPRP